jgi:HD superfamily phosphodiesterase
LDNGRLWLWFRCLRGSSEFGGITIVTIAKIMDKMIIYSDGNIHDIDHLIRVWTYAKTIGELEGIDANMQYILEVAAITHDIACPLCRTKYGNTNGKHQEEEGVPLVRTFLADCGIGAEQIDRIAYLVGHHHTFHDIQGWTIRS